MYMNLSIIWHVGRLPPVYFEYFKSCLQQRIIWNPVKCTRDTTNSEFARYTANEVNFPAFIGR